MTEKEILVGARKLIANPRKWSGPSNHPSDGDCYCSATAIWQAAKSDENSPISSPESLPAGKALAEASGIEWSTDWFTIYRWNDSSDHETVLATFDKAIANADGLS